MSEWDPQHDDESPPEAAAGDDETVPVRIPQRDVILAIDIGGTKFAAGLVTEAHVVGELGEVLAGAASGRREASEITIYKSLGVTTQDLAAGLVALREAERLGLGETLALDA